MESLEKINLGEYLGVDDTDYAVPLGLIDRIFLDEWGKDGAVITVTYLSAKGEEKSQRQKQISQYAGQIAINFHTEDE